MSLSPEDLEAIRKVVREELDRLKSKHQKRRRRIPCGTGSSVPMCMGSVIHGPEGCYCRRDGQ